MKGDSIGLFTELLDVDNDEDDELEMLDVDVTEDVELEMLDVDVTEDVELELLDVLDVIDDVELELLDEMFCSEFSLLFSHPANNSAAAKTADKIVAFFIILYSLC